MRKEIVERLSQYKNVLQKMKSLGFVRVFSDNLGDALNVSPSLVRKDFACFGLKGNKRGGYAVDGLIQQLNGILGKDEPQRIIIAGCGRLGQALIHFKGFHRENIEVVAGFDINHEAIAPEASTPVYDIGQLAGFIRREHIRVGMIAAPERAAGLVADLMIEAGIRGILNFAPVPLKSTPQCCIQNLNLAMEVEKLFSLAHFMEREEAEASGDEALTL